MNHYLRVITLFIFYAAIHVNCFSQEPPYAWAKGIGGKQNDVPGKILVDASGNVYTMGIYADTVDFDPGPGTFIMTPSGVPGSSEPYLLKLDALGHFLWVKRISSTAQNSSPSISDMVFDAAGNLYLTGDFSDTTDFDMGPAIHNEICTGIRDIFVLKADSAGNFLWVKTLGGRGYDLGTSIALDVSGNIFMGGRFTDTVDFDPGTGIYNLMATPASTHPTAFICKLNPSGNFIWAKKMDASLLSLTTDPVGNVIATGLFYDTQDFDPGPGIYNLTTILGPPFFSGPNDYLLKLDAFGNFIWAKGIAATFDDQTNKIVQSDATGNVYLTSTFWGTVDFDPGIGTYDLTASMADAAVMKLNASGQFVWAHQLGFAGGVNRPYSMALDNAGKVCITGNSNGQMFISKFDTVGTFAWTSMMGSIDYASSIVLDASQNIYTTGAFENITDFDMSAAVHSLTATGNSTDVFIYKLGNNSLPLSLLSFTAKKDGKTNRLQWTTAQEINVDKFEIERSNDGREYIKIETVKSGNTSYSFTDNNPLKAINYYRLKITDKDGQFTYSPVRVIHNNSTFSINVYPNPAKDNLQLQLDSDKPTAIQLQVVSMDGKVLLSNTFSAAEGASLRSININTLPKGSYLLKVNTDNVEQVVKFDKL